MIVLIPSFEPDQRLVRIVGELHGRGHQVLVVDDGSGAAYQPIFTEVTLAGAVVVSHAFNKGKGAALKTGFAEVMRRWPGHDVVCADSDGQHSVDDIESVAAQTTAGGPLVLGVRSFTGEVPLRSRFGNAVTRKLFRLSTGLDIIDTQTGLRGLPYDLLTWLNSVPGDRFEYEFEVLLRASAADWDVKQVPIATIYLHDNESSHFRPVRDSLRIYRPLLGYGASSLLGFALDTVMLFVMMALTQNLLVSVVTARVVSASVNYTANRLAVFPGARESSVRSSLKKYAALAGGILAANYLLMAALTLVLPLAVAKLITEVSLVLVSYQLQRRVVFRRRSRPAARPLTDRVLATV